MEDFLRATVQALLDRVSSLESSRYKNYAAIEDMQKKLSCLTADSGQKQEQETLVKGANKQASLKSESCPEDSLGDRLARIETQRAIFESRLENCEKNITSIKQQQNVMNEKKSSNELRLSSCEKELQSLTQKENATNEKIETTRTEIEFKVQNLRNIKLENIESLESSVGQLHSQMKSTKEDIEALKTRTDERISTLTASADERISALNASADERISALTTTTDGRISGLKVTTEERISLIEKETKQVGHLSSDLQSSKEDVEALKQRMEERISEMEKVLKERKEMTPAQNLNESSTEEQFKKMQQMVKDHHVPLSRSEYNRLGALEGIIGSPETTAMDIFRSFRKKWNVEFIKKDQVIYQKTGDLNNRIQAMEEFVMTCKCALHLMDPVDTETEYYNVYLSNGLNSYYYYYRILSINQNKICFLNEDTKQVVYSYDMNDVVDLKKPVDQDNLQLEVKDKGVVDYFDTAEIDAVKASFKKYRQ